ncbi:PREDICTED: E3 ubiquitin-protein ligase RMA1-like [Ipomoea nil]|uniref:E3 ubiquitin-protein ligase RMA1-like n=1 Tax=Ipomoea nil TaxID=35883 RepID=UPI00090138E5|nr:PREDICTED: E3 ubiquitin-protein ligase RMA1-like [Ipomoea nil]
MALAQSFGVEDSSEKASACFDCNICFDFACDPVVTLCGHLYCWPCIYEWFNVQGRSDKHLHCPVCKTEMSHTSVVPLYGSGKKLPESEPESKLSSLKVPPRPSARAQALTVPHSHHRLSSHNSYQSFSPPSFNLADNPAAMSVNHPAVGMFGEMVYARVFGNSESVYAYPNSYHLVGNSNPRLRRQQIQADKSLSRITFFLFCCFLLCLVLF